MAETSPESQAIKELARVVQAENEKTRGKLERAAELEVMTKDEIKALKKVAKGSGEEAKKADKKLRAELNKIANKKEAIKAIEKADEQLAMQGRISGLSEEALKKSDILTGAIGKQKEIMEAQKTELEKLGVKAEDNKQFQIEERKLAEMQLTQAKITGSKQAEEDAKKKIYDLRSNTFLGKIANGITDIKKSAKEKLKTGAKGLFGTFFFGALAVAALAFLNSPYFAKTTKFIKDEIIPAIGNFYRSIKKGGQALITLFTGEDKDGNPVGIFDRILGIFNKDSALVVGLLGIVGLFAASKVAKFLGPLKGALGSLFGGIGGLAKKIPGVPGGGSAAGAGGKGGGIGGAIAKTAGGIGKGIKAMGKGLGGFISGLLKGIASGLAAFANPMVIGGLAVAAAGFLAVATAIRIMSPAFEPIGKLVESTGKAIKSAMQGIGDIVESVGKSVGTVIKSMGESIQGVMDSVTRMSTAGTEATTKQIKELSKIPADALHAGAKGIDAMKEALDGFGGGTFSRVVGKLFGGDGPIDKIIELTKKVPELMKAAEAISVLGAAGSNYAMAEAELERRKKVAELKKELSTSYTFSSDKKKDQAELAALEGQAMTMPTSGGVGNLAKIEGLVSEIVRMKRESARSGGNTVVSSPTDARSTNTTNVSQVTKALTPQDSVVNAINQSNF